MLIVGIEILVFELAYSSFIFIGVACKVTREGEQHLEEHEYFL